MNTWIEKFDTYLVKELNTDINVIRNAKSFPECGIDSLELIYLIQNIENLLNIKIKDEDIFKLKNYSELINYITVVME